MQATYPLEQIKELFQQRNFRITETALQGAAMMNLFGRGHHRLRDDLSWRQPFL